MNSITIPKGYKQTEVGVIPSDWKVKILGELFYFSGGFTASREQLSDDGICYLHYGDIHKSDKSYIDVQKEFSEIPKLNVRLNSIPKKYLLEDGDIVFVDASEDDVGASKHIIIRNSQQMPYISGLHTIVLKSKDDSINNRYKQYCFQTFDVKRQFKFYAVGTKVSGISKTNIAKIYIPYLTKPEQTAIATVLSDVDALIISLEKLIGKKRNIKQGAMQLLLTGKNRLSGFSGKWETKKLGEMCELKNGYAFKSSTYTNAGEYKIITIANVQDGYMSSVETNHISKLPTDIQEHQKLKFGDLLISMTGNVGRVCLVDNDVSLLNQRVGKLEPSKFDKVFIFYVCNSRTFLNSMILRAVGGAQGNLGKSDILEYETKIPIKTEEQSAIAQILSDMDTEIGALDQKLAKYKNIKQGMMQELLTGKTRLV